MSFDRETRNALSKIVATCRRLLTEDVTDQLRGRFGMHPDGTCLPIDNLDHLAEDEKAAAEALRELRDVGRGLSVDRFVRRVLERTAMLPLGALAFDGPQRVANLQKLAAAVGGLARDGRLSLEEVIEALEE